MIALELGCMPESAGKLMKNADSCVPSRLTESAFQWNNIFK